MGCGEANDFIRKKLGGEIDNVFHEVFKVQKDNYLWLKSNFKVLESCTYYS